MEKGALLEISGEQLYTAIHNGHDPDIAFQIA
jgi:hypothetical protein